MCTSQRPKQSSTPSLFHLPTLFSSLPSLQQKTKELEEHHFRSQQRNKDDDDDDDAGSPRLLDLPENIIRQIADFMDPPSLRTFLATCHYVRFIAGESLPGLRYDGREDEENTNRNSKERRPHNRRRKALFLAPPTAFPTLRPLRRKRSFRGPPLCNYVPFPCSLCQDLSPFSSFVWRPLRCVPSSVYARDDSTCPCFCTEMVGAESSFLRCLWTVFVCRLKLFPHQCNALEWMMRREVGGKSGRIEHPLVHHFRGRAIVNDVSA